MNYREARQITDGPHAGRWHYTCRNDDRIWPDGACRDGCAGHDTPEEAYEHERQRLVAMMEIVALSPEARAYQPGRCESPDACAEPATHRVIIGGPGRLESPRLCPAHATREQAARLVTVGPSIASW